MSSTAMNDALKELFELARMVDPKEAMLRGQQILEKLIPPQATAFEAVLLARQLAPQVNYNNCHIGVPFVVETLKALPGVSDEDYEKAITYAATSTGFGKEVVERAVESYNDYFDKARK